MVAADHEPLQVVGLAARAVELGAVRLENAPERAQLDAAVVEERVRLGQPRLALRGARAQRRHRRREQVDLGVLLEQLLQILERRRGRLEPAGRLEPLARLLEVDRDPLALLERDGQLLGRLEQRLHVLDAHPLRREHRLRLGLPRLRAADQRAQRAPLGLPAVVLGTLALAVAQRHRAPAGRLCLSSLGAAARLDVHLLRLGRCAALARGARGAVGTLRRFELALDLAAEMQALPLLVELLQLLEQAALGARAGDAALHPPQPQVERAPHGDARHEDIALPLHLLELLDHGRVLGLRLRAAVALGDGALGAAIPLLGFLDLLREHSALEHSHGQRLALGQQLLQLGQRRPRRAAARRARRHLARRIVPLARARDGAAQRLGLRHRDAHALRLRLQRGGFLEREPPLGLLGGELLAPLAPLLQLVAQLLQRLGQPGERRGALRRELLRLLAERLQPLQRHGGLERLCRLLAPRVVRQVRREVRQVAERDAELGRLRHEGAHRARQLRHVARVERRLGARLPALQPRHALLEDGQLLERDRDLLGTGLQVEELHHGELAHAAPRGEQRRGLLRPHLGLLELLEHLLDLDLVQLQLGRLGQQQLDVCRRELRCAGAAARGGAAQDLVGRAHPLLAARVAHAELLRLGHRQAQRLGLRVQVVELAQLARRAERLLRLRHPHQHALQPRAHLLHLR